MPKRIETTLPDALAQRLELVCKHDGVHRETFVHAAIEIAVKRSERARRRAVAKRRDSVDEPLFARLRVLIAKALMGADGWEELQASLADRGFTYVEKGGGLAIKRLRDGALVCKASQVGPGYAELIRRFRAPFPGHSHVWLAERILDRAVTPGAPPAPTDDGRDDEPLIDYSDD